MAFTLPDLPYSKDALAPHISNETLEYHYGKHHAGYVNKLNSAAENDKSLAGQSLEKLIETKEGKIFNLAAQIWNHTFYWNSMSPNGGGEPTGKIADRIKADFGGFQQFKEKFTNHASGHFGSGWVWLVHDDGKLAIWEGHDADTPVRLGIKPLLTCDVWEHAYYIDQRNNRGAYINAWWKLVNWDFANQNL